MLAAAAAAYLLRFFEISAYAEVCPVMIFFPAFFPSSIGWLFRRSSSRDDFLSYTELKAPGRLILIFLNQLVKLIVSIDNTGIVFSILPYRFSFLSFNFMRLMRKWSLVFVEFILLDIQCNKIFKRTLKEYKDA